VPASVSSRATGVTVQPSDGVIDGGRDLLERLQAVPDPRDARGRVYPVTLILLASLCATAAKCEATTQIGEWVRDAAETLRRVLPLRFDPWRGAWRTPHPVTVSRTLAAVDGEALEHALSAHVAARVAACARPDTDTDTDTEQPVRAIGLDGKAVRGALRPDGTMPHLVAAADHTSGLVLGQTEVTGKSNEIPAARALLRTLGPKMLAGTLITADALHTCRETARMIVEDCHAGYLMVSKANQRRLYQAATTATAGPRTQFPTHEQTQHAHGRLEQRTIRTAPVPDGFDFPHATQLIRITRRRKPAGQTGWSSKETVYAVTSLPAANTSPAQLATAARGHWMIENGVHWIRDTAWHEDHCRVRNGNAPRVLAALRNLVLNLLRLHGTTNIAAALRHNARQAHRPLHLLGLT
jgi:predicted transposase YbfD/YdcC